MRHAPIWGKMPFKVELRVVRIVSISAFSLWRFTIPASATGFATTAVEPRVKIAEATVKMRENNIVID